MTYSHKLLGHIDITDMVDKANSLDWENLKVTKPIMTGDIDPVYMIILFSMPDKQNLLLPRLVVKPDLLNLFKDDIIKVQSIVDEHFTNLEPKRIVINKFFAGREIFEHVDFMYHYENTKRVHIPIITNDKVTFTFPDCTVHMKEGEVTEFNNNIAHSAVNESEHDRVHLIIDFGDKDDPYYGETISDWKHYL